MAFVLTSPLSGILVPIESIPDPVFSQKTLGSGISIDPTSEVLLSPCDGKILHLHRCLHALTISTHNNLEIMIHIGIDTVNLQGKGFLSRVKVGDNVKVGQPLIEFKAHVIAR